MINIYFSTYGKHKLTDNLWKLLYC